MRVARRYVIAGRVQGVGFRWFTHDVAAREGVHGWVRNMADGSVEVWPRESASRRSARSRGAPRPLARPASNGSTSRTCAPAGARLDSRSDDLGVITDGTLKTRIRHVPDFPKPGILFYDVTTLLRDAEGFKLAIDAMSEPYLGQGISLVVGIESRGFILGAAVADRIGAGFVPVRKVGKLPHTTDPRQLRSRVRHRQPRDPQRRGRTAAAGADRRRPAGDRRHRARHGRPGAHSLAATCRASRCSSSSAR